MELALVCIIICYKYGNMAPIKKSMLSFLKFYNALLINILMNQNFIIVKPFWRYLCSCERFYGILFYTDFFHNLLVKIWWWRCESNSPLLRPFWHLTHWNAHDPGFCQHFHWFLKIKALTLILVHSSVQATEQSRDLKKQYLYAEVLQKFMPMSKAIFDNTGIQIYAESILHPQYCQIERYTTSLIT